MKDLSHHRWLMGPCFSFASSLLFSAVRQAVKSTFFFFFLIEMKTLVHIVGSHKDPPCLLLANAIICQYIQAPTQVNTEAQIKVQRSGRNRNSIDTPPCKFWLLTSDTSTLAIHNKGFACRRNRLTELALRILWFPWSNISSWDQWKHSGGSYNPLNAPSL